MPIQYTKLYIFNKGPLETKVGILGPRTLGAVVLIREDVTPKHCVSQCYHGAKLFQSCLTLLAHWTGAHWAPLSMGFFRQEYWSGSPWPLPGDLPDPGIEPASLMPLAWAGGFFTTREASTGPDSSSFQLPRPCQGPEAGPSGTEKLGGLVPPPPSHTVPGPRRMGESHAERNLRTRVPKPSLLSADRTGYQEGRGWVHRNLEMPR